MTQNADIFSVLKVRQIPPSPPLRKWGIRCVMTEEYSSLWQREGRRDLKTQSNGLFYNLAYHSRKVHHE